MATGARRAIVYTRISEDRGGAGLGVERQREDCQALAGRLGWRVVATYSDNDISAFSGRPRPGYQAMIADLDDGRADAVLAWHPDRLHRSPRELEDFIGLLERCSVTVQTVHAGELDFATPSGRMIARQLGAVARYESEHKAERIRRKHEQSAHAGRWRGGSRPFGWDLRDDGTATIDAREARVIRDAAAAILSGLSLGSVVTDLNRRGITTSTGRPWNYTSLRQVITRPRNAGLSELRGEIVGPLVGWPPILSEDVWRSVCAVLTDPSRRRSQSNRLRWLLAGLARCGGPGLEGECGTALKSAVAHSGPPGARQRRVIYRCPVMGPGHVSRAAVAVDDLIGRLVVARLSQDDARPLHSTPRGPADEDLRLEAVALRQRLVDAADGFADGVLTAGQLARVNERIRPRLAEVEASLARSSTRAALADFAAGRDPREVWDGLTVERRRAVVEALMVVTVLPMARGRSAKVFDPEEIRVDWKDED